MAYQTTKKIITKEYILSRISEKEIFEYYLGIKAKPNRLYRSPLRDDRHPTCSFSYRGGRLRFRDWKESGDKDCFDIVAKMFGLDFGTALEKIAWDFELSDKPIVAELVEKLRNIKNKTYRSSGSSDIRVTIQKETKVDREYLESFGIKEWTWRRYKCVSIKKLWVNGRATYYYRDRDPALGYYFGIGKDERQLWKIYFYKRGKTTGSGIPISRTRFVSNTSKMNGWNQLPKDGSTLIITKSMKDVMVLAQMGFYAIAPQAESAIIRGEILDLISDKFTHVYSLYDFDYTGIVAANKLKRNGVVPLFLTNGRFGTHDYGSKDISDYVRDNDFQKAKNLILLMLYETRTKK